MHKNSSKILQTVSSMQTLRRSRETTKLRGGPSRRRLVSGRILMALGLLVGSGVAFFAVDAKVSAAACPAPGSDLGTDTITINVPATATYTVWTRMKAPDTSHNTVNLEIDGNNCYNVGGGSFTATSWASGSGNWIKYQNGAEANVISLQLTQGNHTLKYIGTQAGVEIDRVILSSDASCTPTGTGTNCQSGDSTPPTVTLVAPTNGQSITGNVTLKATATDASGIAKVEFLVGGTVVNGTGDTTSPYEHNWNSASVANGPHGVTARATDTAGNTSTSTVATITVGNTGGGGGPARGDLNNSGKVDLTDLSILLSNWNKTGVTPDKGDVNSSGKVDLTDLSKLLSNWGT
jgi:hypothetical protein